MNTPDLPTIENKTYLRAALGGGAAAAVIALGIGLTVGITSGAPPRTLLESSLPTIRFLASSIATASATTLALLLTLLSFSGGIDTSIESTFYRRLRDLARLDVATFVSAIALLVVLVIPIGDEAQLTETFYAVTYYVLSGLSAVSAGLLISVVLALYSAVDALIETCFLDTDKTPLKAE